MDYITKTEYAGLEEPSEKMIGLVSDLKNYETFFQKYAKLFFPKYSFIVMSTFCVCIPAFAVD